jgi:hypothetical protein
MLQSKQWKLTYATVDENGRESDELFTKEFETYKELVDFANNGYENNEIEVYDEYHEENPVALDEIVFVNVYTITRHYGGPEEGGWYFNWFECKEVIPVQHQYATQLANTFYDKYVKSHKHGDIYSVLGGQDVAVYVELHPKQSETKERPYYE